MATIIPGEASKEHSEHFARLAQMASDNLFDYTFGKQKAHKVLKKLYLVPEHDLSYQNTHFVLDEKDGKIAGMLSGYTGAQKRINDKNNEALMSPYTDSCRFGLRNCCRLPCLNYMLNFLGSELHATDFYIQMLAIYPEYRRHGYGTRLLQHAEQVARHPPVKDPEHPSLPCERLVLDVVSDNKKAIAAYEKFGFVTVNKGVPSMTDFLMLRRMVKNLFTKEEQERRRSRSSLLLMGVDFDERKQA